MLNVSILLASNSPRRSQMLSWLGWQFRIQAQDIDESPLAGEHPYRYVCRLARQKAEAAHSHARPNEWVLAADTIVADGEELLGKPLDNEDARRMLRQLRGRVHQVYTALAILPSCGKQVLQDLCCENVSMRNYSDAEIEEYILSGDALDKAGGYAIQHQGFNPVEQLHGCYACIMGMPMCHLLRTLQRAGLEVNANIPEICQQNLAYNCPVSVKIFQWDADYNCNEREQVLLK